MQLARWSPAPLSDEVGPFETVREVTATVGYARPDATARQLLDASHLRCQRGGADKRGDECRQCERLISILPSRGRTFVRIRCLWTEADTVDHVMRCGAGVSTIPADATLSRADEVLTRRGVHHLLVAEGGTVIGRICRCALADVGQDADGDPVSAHMRRDLWTIAPNTSIAAAVGTMDRLAVGLLVVADGAHVLGTVEHADLGLVEPGHAP
jgi:CBS domain-containing protein